MLQFLVEYFWPMRMRSTSLLRAWLTPKAQAKHRFSS
jgi:hypothetical protein